MFAAFLALAAGMAAPAAAQTLGDIHAAEQAGGVTVRVEVAPLGMNPTGFALGGPRRLVVDLPNAKASQLAAPGSGKVEQVRAAQFSPEAARIVFDLSAPMKIASVRREGGTLVFQLSPVSAAEFAAEVKRSRQMLAVAAPASRPAPRAVQGRAVKKAAPAPQLATRAASAKAPSPRARRAPPRPSAGGLPVVVIDAGHGGKDPGSPSFNGRSEKDAVLAIAKAIKKELDASGRVRTILTRDTDVYLPHRERTAVARNNRAQLFISVHADSFPKNRDVAGATVYTLSETASDSEAARLAARENRSDIIAGVDLASESDDVTGILIDLAQRETMNASAEFAGLLQRELTNAGVPFRSHYHRFAGFLVLKAPDVPAVLLETGYMSNARDSRYLFSDKGRSEIAKGVRRAVEAHFLKKLAQR